MLKLLVYNNVMFYKRLGVDLGTANAMVWEVGEGIVLQEPTVVAVNTQNNQVVAVGNEAKTMLGRTPQGIYASRPMRDGVIADYRTTEAMLKYFIQKVCGKSFLFKPEVMICIPAGATQVEKRAVEEAALKAGGRTIYLIHEPLAAAIGSGINIGEASGNMIVDIGGGACECAVISLGGVVVSHSVRVGGARLDDAITDYVRKQHNLIIGDQTAEKIKIEIGSALPLDKPQKIKIKGRDNIAGLPKTVSLDSNEITKALEYNLDKIIGCVKQVLEQTPPELSSDIVDKGVVMSGGTSFLNNLDRLLTEKTGVSFHVAERPMECVVRGCGTALENIEKYKKILVKR